MKLVDIERIGYFDDVIIDGWLDPFYRSSGFKLYHDMSLVESINFCNRPNSNAVAMLHINILGECRTTNGADLVDIECERARLNLKRAGTCKNRRYIIATADILIIKSTYYMSNGIENSGRNIEALQNLSKTADEANLMIAGLELSKYLDRNKPYLSEYTIAIVNRVYVHPEFRRLGINSWIHDNLSSMINTFGLVYPNIVLLAYGDFAQESGELFHMTTEEYKTMLHKMYNGLGYKDLDKLKRYIKEANTSGILFRLN